MDDLTAKTARNFLHRVRRFFGLATALLLLALSSTSVVVQTICGTVFPDTAGNLLGGGDTVGDANNPGISTATVRLVAAFPERLPSGVFWLRRKFVFGGQAQALTRTFAEQFE